MSDLKKIENFSVYFSNRISKCKKCNVEIEKDSFVALENNNDPFCLSCAGLDHLVFLPSGDAALTKRAAKKSKLSAIVRKFSSTRKRSERQGVLVEAEGLKKAKQECLEDSEIRARNRKLSAKRREVIDEEFIENFAEEIRRLYPSCPQGTEDIIAVHACEKHSGRVGRTADAKKFDEYMINLAVRAHIRHCETRYDNLMISEQYSKKFARERVKDEIDETQSLWQKPLD